MTIRTFFLEGLEEMIRSVVLLVFLIPYSHVIFIEHSLLLDIPYDNDNARYSMTLAEAQCDLHSGTMYVHAQYLIR
jgi:hypothetical protein